MVKKSIPKKISISKNYLTNLAATVRYIVWFLLGTYFNPLFSIQRLFWKNILKSKNKIVEIMAKAYAEKKEKEAAAEKLLGSIDDFVLEELGIKISDIENKMSFIVYSDEGNLVYTGDTGYFNGIEKEYADANILIANCVKGFNSADENNLTADDVVRIILDVKPQLVILTHFGKSLLQSPQMYLAREIYRRTKIQTIAARDGLIIDPFSYSPELKQKSLSFY